MRSMNLKVWEGEGVKVLNVMIKVDLVEDGRESMVCVGQKIRDEFVKLKFIRCKT